MPSLKKFLATLVASAGISVLFGSSAYAATVTVTSTSDIVANDGECTLREAIVSTNTDTASGGAFGECGAGSGIDTINFIISGPADFTNDGEDGYTIVLTSTLPPVTEQATINGYSQPGSRRNSATAPAPFNDIKLVEIDGNGAWSGPELRADGSIIRDLVINNMSGTGILLGADNIGVYGNYIGVEPDGLTESPNSGNGINGGTDGFTDPDSVLIGSADPTHRNIISGNGDAGITPNVGQDDWIIRGNYVGMAADGKTPIPNSVPYTGSGGLSIDNNSGAIVGGSEEGSTNLISGNGNFGIFPDNTTDLVIQGNIIGPDWEGDPIPGRPQLGGIGLPPLAGDILDTLIGGTESGEGNLIAHNNGNGISILNSFFNGAPIAVTSNTAIIGNSIHSNLANDTYLISRSGLGIDLMDGEFSDQSSTTLGPTLNDSGDIDTGPNGYINFPVLNSVEQNGGEATINYSLDAADSPTDEYRIEFFSNDEADPSGYGEGQTFLGAITSENGNNQTASLTLPINTDLEGKYLSATTTAIDATANSGFGATSEFSAIYHYQADTETGSLAETGQDQTVQLRIIVTLLFLSVILITISTVNKRKNVPSQ